MTVSTLSNPFDQGSFEDFYRHFFPRVKMLVARHFPACDAEEIAQETLSRCYAKFDELDPRRDPWPWVSSIARHAAIDAMRRSARLVTTDELPEPAGAADTTYDAVLVGERRRVVRAALTRLKPADRQLIEDREIEGLDLVDMAAMRDITPNALRQKLFRARGRLAVELRRVGASLGVVPVALQARLARLSRRATDVSQAAGPVGASALSVAAVAGVATAVAILTGPVAPPSVSALPRPGAGEPVTAVERGTGTRPAAERAVPRGATPPRRAAAPAAPPAAGPTPELPVVIERSGDPTQPGRPQSYSTTVETPDGEEHEVFAEMERLPGYGILCLAELATCEEEPG